MPEKITLPLHHKCKLVAMPGQAVIIHAGNTAIAVTPSLARSLSPQLQELADLADGKADQIADPAEAEGEA